MCYEKGGHARFIHANADAVACHARLRYFELSAADAESIADADLAIRKSINGEVFLRMAEDKAATSEEASQ